MPSLFPSASALSAKFGHATPYQTSPAKRTSYSAQTARYSAWSVTEDAEKKAAQLSDAAVKEFNKASEAAQAKAGKIELYSGKYCAAYVPSDAPQWRARQLISG